MRSLLAAAVAFVVTGCAAAALTQAPAAPLAPHHVIAGGVYDGKGPNGNTIVLDAPLGLIVVDTGRHPDHAQAVLDFAASTGKPIAAIVNTHWHFDHTTGNREVLAAFPGAAIVGSGAIDGALYKGFSVQSRAAAEDFLKSGKPSAAQRAEIERGFYAMDNLQLIRPTRPVTANGPMTIAGRTIDVRLAPFAVSEGDVWLVVPDEKMVIVGDLVVDIVPFMDTACVDGWSKALAEVAATQFEILIPGHGEPMTKPQFLQWKSAFDNFAECGRSTAAKASCVDGWMRDAAPFIGEAHRKYARDAAGYYIDTRLRASAKEQQRFCGPPAAS